MQELVIMRFTASVNKLIWYFVVPFLLIFYLFFLFWSDHSYTNKPVYESVKNKQQIIKSLEGYEGVILGGSNIWWGLSAKSLTTLTNITWVNLATPAESYSDVNYANFISDTLSYSNRKDISFVIYSSSNFTDANRYNKRKVTTTDQYGKNKLSYKPQRSFASYLKEFLGYTKYRPYPLENKYGDFGFSDYPCDTYKPTPLAPRDYMTINDLSMWLPGQLDRISGLFPNAKIILNIPNGFNGDKIWPNNDARSILIGKIKEILSNQVSADERFSLISQKPYPSSDLMCSDDYHANHNGREWHTKELHKLIEDQL